MESLLLNYEIALLQDVAQNKYVVSFGIDWQATHQRCIAVPRAFVASNGWKVRSSTQSNIEPEIKTIHLLGADYSGDAIDRLTHKVFSTLTEAQEVHDAINFALKEWKSNGGFTEYEPNEDFTLISRKFISF